MHPPSVNALNLSLLRVLGLIQKLSTTTTSDNGDLEDGGVSCYSGPQNSSSSSSSKYNKSKMNEPVFDYIVCIDFEATCWENQAPPQWRESEIIEFPAVLLNLKTGKIESEFHKYIMPMESPRLSAYCTALTGINQKMVDNGIPLQTALLMFQEWLRDELRTRNLCLPRMSKDNKMGNCAIGTWTDWDLDICLHKECIRKRLKKPQFFNRWINLKAIYRHKYQRQHFSFSDALKELGLTFVGREHSGIDDARNLASLTYKLVNEGAKLLITRDLQPYPISSSVL